MGVGAQVGSLGWGGMTGAMAERAWTSRGMAGSGWGCSRRWVRTHQVPVISARAPEADAGDCEGPLQAEFVEDEADADGEGGEEQAEDEREHGEDGGALC